MRPALKAALARLDARPAVRKVPAAQSEALIQAQLLEVLRLKYPQVLVAHVANGGMIMDPRVVAKLKWQGLLPGFPDLVVYWPGGHGLAEVKRPKCYPSPEQRAIHAALHARGHKVAIWRSVEDMERTLERWGVKPGRAAA